MAGILDTNVAWRRIQLTDPQDADLKSSIDATLQAGQQVHVSAQNLTEFPSVATRSQSVNGLGPAPAVAALKPQELEVMIGLLPETPAIYPQWRTLVHEYAVCGKQVHDARLVAIMLVHGATHLLTLNETDFQRFSGVTVVEP